ncbi:MAG: peptidase S16 [Desulfobulbaceae bacterium]|nr:MAG: peptidase S16 [Desulfobulbaceae bacterium]
MSRSPFFPAFESLPKAIPIFPLAGAVVMPGVQLPLNIFEPRYLNMVQDALANDHIIGMIQPVRDTGEEAVQLQRVGSAGRITSYSESDDGRIIMVLTGICRFGVYEEIGEFKGYRRVIADWSSFASDCDEEDVQLSNRAGLFEILHHYIDARQLEISWDDLGKLADGPLINLLCSYLPFEPEEKQALIETIGLDERAELMRGLMNLYVATRQSLGDKPH